MLDQLPLRDVKALFDTWALVELFGHQRLAGRLREESIGGATFLRLEVPATAHTAAWTKLYGPGAVYAITPMTEGTARALAAHMRAEPLSEWEMRTIQQKARDAGADDADVLDHPEGLDEPDAFDSSTLRAQRPPGPARPKRLSWTTARN